MAKVKKGDLVKIHYEGRLENDKVFDSTKDKEPLEFTVGEGKVLKAIDDGVVGMEAGEEKELKLGPEQAFGKVMDNLQQTVPVREIEKLKVTPKVGLVLQLEDEQGRKMQGLITKMTEQNVLVDFNHPLAGRKVIYKVKIESIN